MFAGWVFFCAFVVAVGVVLEGPEILHELFPKLFVLFTFPSTERLHRFERKIKKIGLIGWLLVVFGVAGEGIFEVLQHRAEGQVQAFNDILLADAQKRAENAATSARNARADAGIAQDAADKADKDAGEAKGEADGAKSTAAAVGKQAADLTRQMSSATQELASAKQALLDMSVCLAPRVIRNESIIDSVTRTVTWSSLDPVRPYSGFQAIIDVAPDAEARRAAANIENALRAAGWAKVTVLQGVDGLSDGVEVSPWDLPEYGDKPAEMDHNLRMHWDVEEAADAVVDLLHSFNWQVERSGGPNADIPSNAMTIKVGLYPAVEFIAPPGGKQFADTEAVIRKSQQEGRQQFKNELEKTFEEHLAKSPPEFRARMRADWDREQEDERKVEERLFSQPCRLVSP